MNIWTPIPIEELDNLIQKNQTELHGQFWNFWQLIKINPVKWQEEEYGDEGGGFWVVAICGTKVIWYNDIEEGFNISNYTQWGKIDEYCCNQDEINIAVMRMSEFITYNSNTIEQTR
ncbi:hypothetical protein [Chryseobacterium sp. JUb7]|uniref:hypothetical protein n=1 Tax=Chryseobacterium sp. JUb7 TaxID=2940599 RepID=UPI0021684D2D|nr:hypothetical protein [Chryseobacterium sp. JUb7]MCS3532058.1 hypothetical protein [Chryseobacterium sp. JUb7]